MSGDFILEIRPSLTVCSANKHTHAHLTSKLGLNTVRPVENWPILSILQKAD